MTTLMGQEKQRISERLARLDGEREKLSAQLSELEIAERSSLSRSRAAATPRARQGKETKNGEDYEKLQQREAVLASGD
jgi:hypothetical protein